MNPADRAAADQLRAASRDVVDGIVAIAADTVATGDPARVAEFARDWVTPLFELEPRELYACVIEMIGRLGAQEATRRAARDAIDDLRRRAES